MFRSYAEGVFLPRSGGHGRWHVWCCSGAEQVLEKKEYVSFLRQHPDRAYLINFANGALAGIRPGDRLWRVLQEVAKRYDVLVFPAAFSTRDYVPWTGGSSSCRNFDAIQIKNKG